MTKPIEAEERTEIISALRRIANELGTPSVSCSEFAHRTGLGERKILRLFGSYNGLVEAAGLVPNKAGRPEGPRHTNQELMAEMVRVLRIPNSKLSLSFFERNARISTKAYLRTFRTWSGALNAAAQQLDPQQDGDLVSRIHEYTGSQATEAVEPIANGPPPQTTATEKSASCSTDPEPSPAAGGFYGDLVRFRALEHAPVNEQGVILLFGMICKDLGYVIEIMKNGFPDCEAKRRVRPGVWQRVRLEFEFRSRTFKSHGHDPRQCDVIVCWEDNWPECPIEVQELKSLLPRLRRQHKRPPCAKAEKPVREPRVASLPGDAD